MDSKSIRIKLLEEIIRTNENSWKRTALKSVYGWVSYFTSDENETSLNFEDPVFWDATKTAMTILLSACGIYLLYKNLLRPVLYPRRIHQVDATMVLGRNRWIPVPDKVQDKPVSERTTECTLCYDRQNQVALVPCGHACFCLHCIKGNIQRNKDKCPICNKEIEQVVSLYY